MAFWRPCNQLWAQLGAKPGLVDSILLEIGRWMGLSGILLPLAGCWCQRWHWTPLKLHSVCLQWGLHTHLSDIHNVSVEWAKVGEGTWHIRLLGLPQQEQSSPGGWCTEILTVLETPVTINVSAGLGASKTSVLSLWMKSSCAYTRSSLCPHLWPNFQSYLICTQSNDLFQLNCLYFIYLVWYLGSNWEPRPSLASVPLQNHTVRK